MEKILKFLEIDDNKESEFITFTKVKLGKEKVKVYVDVSKRISFPFYKEIKYKLEEEFKKPVYFYFKLTGDYSDAYFKDYYEDLIKDVKGIYKRFLKEVIYKDGVRKVDVINDKLKKSLEEELKPINKILKDLYYEPVYVEINKKSKKEIHEEVSEEIDKKINMTKGVTTYTKRSSNKRGVKLMEKNYEITPIKDVKVKMDEAKTFTIHGEIFETKYLETRKSNDIFSAKIWDGTDSFIVKTFVKKENESLKEFLGNLLKEGKRIIVRGNVSYDEFEQGEETMIFNEIREEIILKEKYEPLKEERVELHTHTKMSTLDSPVTVKELINKALDMGHRGIAITDHDGIYSFPEVYNMVKKINSKREDNDHFKALYGTEISMVDDDVKIVLNDNLLLKNFNYTVFDIETTGLDPKDNSIIEIGAYKVIDNKLDDSFNELIKIDEKVPELITSLTGITDKDLENGISEKEALIKFLEFSKNTILVAHNAKFDMSFINEKARKYKLDINTYALDTMVLSRYLFPKEKYHKLNNMTSRLEVDFEEDKHHRADYDAKGTAEALLKMFDMKDISFKEALKIKDSFNNPLILDFKKTLYKDTIVVFDLETTGFNPLLGDSIIEIGAVKIKDGHIIDRYDELINPSRKLPEVITNLTGITDEMLKDKKPEKEVLEDFINWIGDSYLVAHNASFDFSFLDAGIKKYKLKNLSNPVIDTLIISRFLDPDAARHSLTAVTKRYDITFNEDEHHRGDYDAEATALVFSKMLRRLETKNISKIYELVNLINEEDLYKQGRSYHINLLAMNREGLKNLYRILSLALTKNYYKGEARILKSELSKYRDNLLVGSGCYLSEVFTEARSVNVTDLETIISFYDYVEVQAPSSYIHLLDTGDFPSESKIKETIKKIIKATKSAGKIMVVTGDVHTLNKEDELYRKILINQNVPGGGRHPLNRKNIKNIPNNYFKSTKELLKEFEFLKDDNLIKEIIIDNPNKILDMADEIEVILETHGKPFAPKIEDSANITKEMVYKKARELYGNDLPDIVESRIENELNGIINNNYDVIYLIAHKLVKKSHDEGYVVGSRGSVGSSLVATMMDITEVNPLPPHYRCPKCKYSEFKDEEGKLYQETIRSGYDLEPKKCPKCGSDMLGDGNDMPFATFLGFNGDKVPDIDLNFSGEYQSKAHDYTKVLFGEDKVFRAGTVGTAAEKTCFGYVKGYAEEKGINMRNSEVIRIAKKLEGCKRTTGQHPGGIVVIPNDMDIYNFTPFQYPANEKGEWYTTHYEYHALEDNLLKLDILGHDDPTMFKMLCDNTGIKYKDIPIIDKKVLSLLTSPEALGVTSEDLGCKTGTLGLPELGTQFVIRMLTETKPKTFSDLVKISGLSHGTDVWTNNAQDLVASGIPFEDVIGCRDDIMTNLISLNIPALTSFKIMEFIRKGKASFDKEKWGEYRGTLEEYNVPEWYIKSCDKIKYLFPKAHATAYVMSALRIAWFKVYYPVHYYATLFSLKTKDLDIHSLLKGVDNVNYKLAELDKMKEKSPKESSTYENLKLVKEALVRGFKFLKPDIHKSDAFNFKVLDDNTLLCPFVILPGLGDKVAKNIVNEREEKDFDTIEDFQLRSKVSKTIMDNMRALDIFEGMDESRQLSFF